MEMLREEIGDLEVCLEGKGPPSQLPSSSSFYSSKTLSHDHQIKTYIFCKYALYSYFHHFTLLPDIPFQQETKAVTFS